VSRLVILSLNIYFERQNIDLKKEKQCMNTSTFGFIDFDNSNCQSQLSYKSQKSNCHSNQCGFNYHI
jgi:hypothetical protein